MAKNIVFRLQAETKQLRSELDTVKSQLKNTQAEAGKVGKTFSGLGATIKNAIGAFAAFEVARRLITGAAKTVSDFQVAMKQLQSITGEFGAEGEKNLEKYRDAAIDLSVRFGTSADDMVKSFQLVKSAMAELTTEGVIEVASQADILANAIGVDASQAAEILTKSLNQFGASADDASSFVDILATSQQKGTATANSISEALKNVGAVASDAGMTFQETNVALQALAKGGLEGAEAGTGLRSVILKLQKAGVGFVDGQFNLQAAVEETKKKFDAIEDPVEKVKEGTKLFGEENIKVGNTLMAQIGVFDELTGKLNEAGNALQQAENNNKTLSGSINILTKQWDAFVLSIESGSGPITKIIQTLVDGLSDSLAQMQDIQESEFLSFWEKLAAVASPSAAALLEYKTTILELTKSAQTFTKESQLKEIFKEIAIKTRELVRAQQNGTITQTIYNEKLLSLQAISRIAGKRLAEIRGEIFKTKKATDEGAEAIDNLISIFTRARTIGEIQADLKAAQAATAGLTVGSAELRKNLFLITQLQEELAAATGKTTEAQKEQKKETESQIKVGEIWAQIIKEQAEAEAKRREELEKPIDFSGVEAAFDEVDEAEQESARISDEAFFNRLKLIDEEKEARRQAANELKEQAFETADALIAAQIAETEGAIAAQERRVQAASEIAEKGNAEQLQREEQRLNELNEKKAAFVRQQQTLATIEIVSNSAIAISKAAAEGGAAAPFTIAATLLALTAGLVQARQLATTAAFAEGGYTGDGGKYEPAGTVHKGEFVFDKATTQRHRALFEDIHKGRPITTTASGDVFVINNKEQNERLERIERAILQQPGMSLVFDEKGVHGLVRRMEYKNSRIKGRA